jgi:hypothetical protein
LDPIATRDKECSKIKIPTTSITTSNDGAGGSFGDDVPEGVTDTSSVAAREESLPTFLLLSTTTGIVIFVSIIVLSGLLGSSFTFLIMRRFSNNNNNNNTNNHSRVPVDYGDAWDINNDDNNDDNNVDYSFEMTTSESRFRDELPDHDEF